MSFNSRGTGKTTARVLQSIADALLHPDTPVAVVPDDFSMNHWDQSYKHLENFAEIIRSKSKCLGITLDVEVADHAVLLTSPITDMREEHNRKCDPAACDTDEKSSALRDAELAVSIAKFEVKSAAESLAKALRGIVLPEGCASDQIKKDAEFLLNAANEAIAAPAPDMKDYLKDFDLRTSEGHKMFCEAADSLRKAFPGRVLPKGTEIVQQQPTSEASKPEASIPNAQSDANKDFIRELNNNRTLRQVCHVVDSHMAKELGFQNLREYRDAVRASILSFKAPPEQFQAQQQSEIPEVSFPQEFKLMPQRWPDALMKWNIQKQRYESKPYSITCNGTEFFEAIVVKYPDSKNLQWMRGKDFETEVLGIVFAVK